MKNSRNLARVITATLLCAASVAMPALALAQANEQPPATPAPFVSDPSTLPPPPADAPTIQPTDVVLPADLQEHSSTGFDWPLSRAESYGLGALLVIILAGIAGLILAHRRHETE